jgi:hypothetical protein
MLGGSRDDVINAVSMPGLMVVPHRPLTPVRRKSWAAGVSVAPLRWRC